MMEESRGEEAPDVIVTKTAVEEEDADQFTLIRAFIREEIQVVPTQSLTCLAVVERLIQTALIVNV